MVRVTASTPDATSDVQAPSTPTDRRLVAALFVGFVLLAALLHLPTFGNHVFNTDEAYLATEAQVLDRGGQLYVDTVDRKPPLVPYVYAAVFRATGTDDLTSVRVVAVLAHAATALLLAIEARRRFPRRWSPAVAGALYLLAAVAFRPQDAQAANFEVFMLPFMTASIVLAARRRVALSGMSLAVATLAKQTAATTLLPIGWLAWRARRGRGLLLLATSFAVPILVVATVIGFHDFFFWVFTGNGNYLDVSGVLGYALSLGARQTAWFVLGHAVVVVLAALAWRHRRSDADLWLWTASAAVAVLAGMRFFPHYYLQALPPLCLLATRTLTSPQFFDRRWVAGALSIVLLGTTAYYYRQALTATDNRNARIAFAVARYVGAHAAHDDRVFVWGHAPEVYWASDRLPATRFLTTGYLTGESGGRPPDRVGMQYATPDAWRQFDHDLARHPPTLIVDMSTANQRNARFYPPHRFRRFARYLGNGDWRRVAVVDGATIYRRSGT